MTEEHHNLGSALACEALGVPDTPENRQHLGTLQRALAIYNQRGRTRGELWRDFGVEDKLHHIDHKAARVRGAAKLLLDPAQPADLRGEALIELVDDAVDLINYTVFLIIQAEEVRIDG
jgi:hypothetical protein